MANEEPVRIARKMGIVRIHRRWEFMDGNSRSDLRDRSGPLFGCGAEMRVRCRAGWERRVIFSRADGERRRLLAWRMEFIFGLVFFFSLCELFWIRYGEKRVRQAFRDIDIT